MLIFERPHALWLLFLAVPLVLAHLRGARRIESPTSKRLSIVTVLLAWCAFVFALAAPWVRSTARPVRVFIDANQVASRDDRSNQTNLAAQTSLASQWRADTPARDRFHVVRVGAIDSVGAHGRFDGEPTVGEPDLGRAIEHAISLCPETGEIVLAGSAGDGGLGLEPVAIGELADRLRARDLTLHVRTRAVPRERPAILTIEHPARAAGGDPFAIRVRLVSPTPRELDLTILRADRATPVTPTPSPDAVLAARRITVPAGESSHVIHVTPPRSVGPFHFEARLERDTDSSHGEHGAILVQDGIVAGWLGRGDANFEALRSTLAPHGIALRHLDPGDPVAQLAEVDCAIVDNLSAADWSSEAQRAVADLITRDGLGLLLAGAHDSLGPGGYATSPLADLLPVEMPQREERRDPSVALVVVIDTSGSMGARIDLAKEVARLALRRLLPHDKAGIVEFYGSKRWAAPLQPASNLIELMRALDRMQAGGGTVIYSALEESYYALLDARTRFRHVLVLTDGGVESGPFESLARRMAESNIQLSTVLIGPQAQSQFLMDLAQWGGGRFYACPSRFQLPDLRFKEPQTTLLPSLREEAVAIDAAQRRENVASLADGVARSIGGLVEAHAKPDAESLLRAADGSSVLAAWDQGRGRIATLATELLGPMSDPIRSPAWSDFLADQVRSLARGRQSSRPELTLRATRGGLHVTFHDMTPRPAPRLRMSSAGDDTELRIGMQRATDGTWRASVPWLSDDVCTLEVDGQLLGAAIRPQPRDDRLEDRSEALEALASATGGTTSGPLPTTASRSAKSGRVPVGTALALVGLLAMALHLLARRWPGRGMKVTRAAAVALVATMTMSAQERTTGTDITSRIDHALRHVGSLEELRDESASASLGDRLAIAIAAGDLAEVVRLCDTAPRLDLAQQSMYAIALEILGDEERALRVLRQRLDATGPDDPERAAYLVHSAELHHALGDSGGALAALRAAADAEQDPSFRHALGILAADLGHVDLALELHVPMASASAMARANGHLRRAQWLASANRRDDARAEFARAASLAPLERERTFAYARLLDLATDEGQLRAFIADSSSASDSDNAAGHADLLARFDAVRRLGDGDLAVALLGSARVQAESGLLGEAMRLCVECGRTEPAVEAARTLLERNPGDSRLRGALALLYTDLEQPEKAHALLVDRLSDASPRERLALIATATELGDERAVQRGVEICAASAVEEERVDGLLADIAALRKNRRDSEAIERLLAARARVEQPQSLLRLAGALESLGQSAEAVSMLREIRAKKPTEDVSLRLAWLLSTSKDETERNESIELFREVWLTAGSAARRSQAQERVLDLASRNGTLADLALELEAAIADPTAPDRDTKREALVRIWVRAMDGLGARDVLLAWAKESPDHTIDAWQAIAQACLLTDDFAGQQRALEHLIAIDPASELDYRQQLVLAFLERGRAGQARAIVRELLARDPSPDGATLEFAAGILGMAGRPAEAARLYRRAFASDANRIETLLLWANAMRDQGKAPEAIGTCAILLSTEVPADLFLVAVDGLLNLGAEPAVLRFAERALRRRIAQEPDRVYLQRALQDVLEQLGDAAARQASLESTILIAGQQRSAWLREAMENASSARDWPRYLRHARALLMIGEEAPPAVFLEIGETLLGAGDLAAAERAFLRARLAPEFASVERRIATAFETAGRPHDAERVLRRILRRDPADVTARLDIARLAELRGDRDEARRILLAVAIELTRSETMPTKEAGTRGFSRNVTTDLPNVDAVFARTVRTADTAQQLAPLRDAILARADGREPLSSAATVRLAARLRSLADTLADSTAADRARKLEDTVLSASDVSAPTKQALIRDAIARGEIDRLLESSTDLANRFPLEHVRALLLAGRDGEVAAAVIAGGESALLPIVRLLIVTEREAIAQEIFDAFASRTANDDGNADARAVPVDLSTIARLVGREFDEARARRDALERAFAAAVPPAQRVQRSLAALERIDVTEVDLRTDYARRLVSLAREANDPTVATSVLDKLRGSAAESELAPLVEVALQKVQSPYLLAARCRHLDLLAIDDAERMLRTALRSLGGDARVGLLQTLSDGRLPATLASRMIEGMSRDKVAVNERTWLTRIATSTNLPDDVLFAMSTWLLRADADNSARRLLDLRLAKSDSARATALEDLANDLTARTTLDYSWFELAGFLVDHASRAERTALIARVGTSAGDAAGTVLSGMLEAANGDAEAAAVSLTRVAIAQSDNLSLQNQVCGLLETLGRSDDILSIYANWAAKAATIYPFQASRFVQMLIARNRLDEARSVLDRTEDRIGQTIDDRARLAIAWNDPADREREIVRTLASDETRDSRVMVVLSSIRSNLRRFSRAEFEWSRAPLPAAPRSAGDALSHGDILGFANEAAEPLRRQLERLSPSQRIAAADLHRGWLRATTLADAAQTRVAEAVARVQTEPNDHRALATLWAATQLGQSTGEIEFTTLLRRRLLLSDLDDRTLLDALWTANAVGHDDSCRRLLRILLADRAAVLALDQRADHLPRLLPMAARLVPTLLSGLRARDRSFDVALDGALLAFAVLSGEDTATLRNDFGIAIDMVRTKKVTANACLLTMPWAGLCLREGAIDEALAVLGIEDPSLLRLDNFAPLHLDAAVPPLTLWRDPTSAERVAMELVRMVREQSRIEVRFFLLRIAARLAQRLDDAGQPTQAATVRGEIRANSVGIRAMESWLQATGDR